MAANKTKAKPRTTQIKELEARVEKLEAMLAGKSAYATNGHKEPAEDDTERLGFCALPEVAERTLPDGLSPSRERLIRYIEKKWVNGTKLRYFFFTDGKFGGSKAQQDIVRDGFKVWEEVGLGLTFEEIDDIDEAEIRIGFERGKGSWSFVGRDVLSIPRQHERTMNFGWDLRHDPRGVDTPVHEIGHTLGFPHEHQNPFAGIEWDEDAVVEYFGGPPNNWSRRQTQHNVLRKLSTDEVRGSEWDPDSIMHYSFRAGLIRKPEQFNRDGIRPRGGLSERDVEQARFFYPKIEEARYPKLEAFQPAFLSLQPGEQENFSVAPPATRTYTFQTFGGSDTVMVLFEDIDGDLKFVAGDDDSGDDRNASFKVRLYQNRRYVLRVRLYLNYATGDTAAMMW